MGPSTFKFSIANRIGELKHRVRMIERAIEGNPKLAHDPLIQRHLDKALTDLDILTYPPLLIGQDVDFRDVGCR